MFALPCPPAAVIGVAGGQYRMVRVFKHDFFAATCLYEATGPAEIDRIVVKIYRTQPLLGLGMTWLGRCSRDHEKAIYSALAGIAGVPRWVGCVGETGFAAEYIDADPLDHVETPPPGYFDRMRVILDAIHARGVAYIDANKRSNMLVGPDGQAFLVDFQISLGGRDDWPGPLRALRARVVRYLQAKDIYYLCKHKRRLAPGELTADEERLSRRRQGWRAVYRTVAKRYRTVRRRLLGWMYRSGRLVSPTARLEDHRQPEKDTWRKD